MSVSTINQTSKTSLANAQETEITPPLKFVSLAENKNKFSMIEQTFKERIEPLYGEQDQALNKIKKREDRKTEILTQGEKDIGIIVYKRKPNDEYKGFGLENSLELKTLLLIDPDKFSGWGYGTQLIQRVIAAAQRVKARGVHVTVSEKAPTALEFFNRRGFRVVHTWENKYKNKTKEFLLFKGIQEKRTREDFPGLEKENEQKNRKSLETSEQTPSWGKSEDTQTGKRRKIEPFVSPTGRMEYSTPIHLAEGFHQLTLKKPYIDPIRTGAKSIEGRIASGAPSRFKAGDKLRFFYPQNPVDDVTCKISKIEKFGGFKEMLEVCGFKKCIPHARTLEEAVKVYDDIPGFTERARKSGVLAIHLQK